MASKPILGLSAVETMPVHERVYHNIVKALMSGQFEPDQKLTSRKLAKELGTSDMPVRSALMRLQALQALKAQPNGTMKLPDMTRDHFSELMEARRVVEGGATELAAQHVNGNKLRTIRRHCAQLTKAAREQDINSYLLNNYNFKFSIYNCCGCQPLIFLIETLWMQAGPFLRNFAGKFDGDLSGILEIDYHEDALAALEVGDGNRAAEAIRRDIAEGRTYLLKYARFGDA